ncbi:hypothetical protein [Streptomyces sp. NPDC049099]|uniref:hypothetical protein n=1 Tax=unclassified Streptomyces TaxID=2593676 RepID=UPI00343C3F64
MKTGIAKGSLTKTIGKAAVVAALATAAFSMAGPSASASAESHWTYGCRGYWYHTSGHAYCDHAYAPADTYLVTYDCNNELDEQKFAHAKWGYVGKISSYECTFKINKTRVTV